MRARDWSTALSSYDNYLALNPGDWAIWVQRGHAQKELGLTEAATCSYRHATELRPDQPDPWLHLASMFRLRGQIADAIDAYQRSAALGEPVAERELAPLVEETAARPGRSDRERFARMPLRPNYVAMVADRPRQAWIGSAHAEGLECIDLAARHNFRADARWHNSFDAVWLFEQPLSELPPSRWKLLLDEAIRLLDEDGRLIVRYEQNDETSVMAIRSFLARRPGLTITMDPPDQEDGRIMHDIFHIKRDQIAAYRDRSWSFVILAQGNRTPIVVDLLERLKVLGKDLVYEIIIVGPNLPEYKPYDILLFDKPYRTDYAQIALKKNDAARFASNANLCIMHDRFRIEDDFFTGFEEFGYDFDLVAVRQQYATGELYPFYAELSKGAMVWSVPIHTMTYQDVRPTHFVNGGFMVFKRTTFAQIGYNPLLGWNEAEDVEVSNVYLSRGLPARVNLLSSATTTVPTSHTAMFLPDTAPH